MMAEPRLLWRIPEVAERLACGRSTVYELIRSKELLAVHMGRSVRIPAVDLEAYLSRIGASNAQE
jgi:excisionase family DNA binding protein